MTRVNPSDPYGDGLGALPAIDQALLPIGSDDVLTIKRGKKYLVITSASGKRATGKTLVDAMCNLAGIDVLKVNNDTLGFEKRWERQ